MIKIIINADDCGYNQKVDFHIRQAIERGKVTSTTIMANMNDIEGAKELFLDFCDEVSFGVHLNLTSGSPLLESLVLLDKGIYKEVDGKIVFNGDSFRNNILSPTILREIEKEWSAQIEKILDNNIKISHIDSHHHIHTGIAFWTLIPRLAEKYRIERFRRMRNFVPPNKFGQIQRQIWTWGCKLQNRNLRTPDYFASFDEFYPLIQRGITGDYTIELMCHPGGIYEEEEAHLLKCDFGQNIKLI